MKKLLAVLLAVMMLAALTVPALAAEPAVIEEEPVIVEEPAADAAAHAHDGVTFRNSLLAGTFYLTKNIDLSEVVGLPQDMTVPANMTLQLCLNGYELTADLDMIVRGTVNIYDCQGGGALRLGDGGITVEEGGCLNVYSGFVTGRETLFTVRGSMILSGGGIACGGGEDSFCVKVQEGGSFVMTGGSVIGLRPVDAAEGASVSFTGGHVGAKAMTGPGMAGAVGTGVSLTVAPDPAQLAEGVKCVPAEEGFVTVPDDGEPEPAPVPDVAVAIAEDGRTAKASGADAANVYARVALVLDNNGVSGLYVTQAAINADGTIVIPAFMVPGLAVKAVNVALVPQLEDITKPNPQVAAMDFRTL